MWRLVGALLTVAGTGTLVGGAAFAYFTATGSGTGTGTVGSVSLTVNNPATQSCSYSSLVPGDLTGLSTCALSVSYTGTGTAWVSLTVAVQAKAGSEGSAKGMAKGNAKAAKAAAQAKK